MACSCLSWTVPPACALNQSNAIGIYLRWQAAEAGPVGVRRATALLGTDQHGFRPEGSMNDGALARAVHVE
jgi:hypothetical protein